MDREPAVLSRAPSRCSISAARRALNRGGIRRAGPGFAGITWTQRFPTRHNYVLALCRAVSNHLAAGRGLGVRTLSGSEVIGFVNRHRRRFELSGERTLRAGYWSAATEAQPGSQAAGIEFAGWGRRRVVIAEAQMTEEPEFGCGPRGRIGRAGDGESVASY